MLEATRSRWWRSVVTLAGCVPLGRLHSGPLSGGGECECVLVMVNIAVGVVWIVVEVVVRMVSGFYVGVALFWKYLGVVCRWCEVEKVMSMVCRCISSIGGARISLVVGGVTKLACGGEPTTKSKLEELLSEAPEVRVGEASNRAMSRPAELNRSKEPQTPPFREST